MKTCETETFLASGVEASRQPAHGSRLSAKIQARHLERQAVVYVRQSSPRQVQENIESTQLQYGLVDRAKAIGWPDHQVVVIDDDLGLSGQSLEGRAGFQRLLAEISLGHVGIVLGIEMSRLARSCRDWHQLLDLCAVFGALLGDADGVYEPRDYNDRLLLGLKGTMSEAELHILRGRLDAGKRNKARRGEYYTLVPTGYLRTDEGVVLEPDEQARNVVQLLLDKFEELGSVNSVLRYFRGEGIRLGIRAVQGPDRGQLTWRVPSRTTLLGILHHPAYAGAYVYGRRKSDPSRRVAGKRRSGRRWATPEEWEVLIRDALPAYITWQQWEKNQAKLKENSTKFGRGAPRGASLLAGLVVCGRCGSHLSISYAGKNNARFTCDVARCQWGAPQCQSLRASPLETLVVEQVLRALEPAALALSLQAAECIEAEQQRIETHHRQTVERATHDADVARRRYETVEPENRLVAAELERRWESALQVQRKAEEAYDRFCREKPSRLTAEQRESILALAQDIPALWHGSSTCNTDRQLIIRALIDQIVVEVLGGTERVSVAIHWAGGFESHHEIRRAVSRFEKLEAADEIAQRIRVLCDEGYRLPDIADQLNREGYCPARGEKYTKTSVGALCRKLRRLGMIARHPAVKPNYWRPSSLAKRLGVKRSTLSGWRRRGWVQAQQVGGRRMYWADQAEMKRLEQLAARDRTGFKVTPRKLTTAVSRMPEC
jgi:DNA invertase Pin-like site-specific DNA recombinase